MPQKWKQVPEFFQWFLFFQHLSTACLAVAGNTLSQNLFLLHLPSAQTGVPTFRIHFKFSLLLKSEKLEERMEVANVLGLNDFYDFGAKS